MKSSRNFFTLSLFSIVSEMAIGQLVHDDSFSLFDAMSALELMDPKMDAGMLRHKKREVLDFEMAKQVKTVCFSDYNRLKQ